MYCNLKITKFLICVQRFKTSYIYNRKEYHNLSHKFMAAKCQEQDHSYNSQIVNNV